MGAEGVSGPDTRAVAAVAERYDGHDRKETAIGEFARLG